MRLHCLNLLPKSQVRFLVRRPVENSEKHNSNNFSNVTATWAGIDIKAGLDVGLSIAVARTTARNTFKPTGSGKLIKIRQTDESGTLTATIDYSSPTHGLLMAQLELETVSVFTLYDGNTGRRWFYKNATLITEPDLALGVDTGPFAWAWMFESSTFQPGDHTLNQIGS